VGNRHHFIPRFYLGAFQSAPRRICLFNLNRAECILDVSLRDQCYAHRLYGSDEIEDALAGIEGAVAGLFRRMREEQKLPGSGTAERGAVMLFIGFQLARTLAAQANAVKSSKLMADVAFDGAPPADFALSAGEAMRLMLSVGPVMGATIRDLAVTLIRAERGAAFVTSDDPVFRYNSYCEGITDFGVLGTKCRGLQLFMPIGPSVLLYMFDPGVYKLLRKGAQPAVATKADVEELNRLQLVGAHENVYFHDRALASWLHAAAAAVPQFREQRRPRITRAVDSKDEHSELLHQYWPMPALDLHLSFVSVRAKARQVPLFARARQKRTPYKREAKERDVSSGEYRRFEVRSRH
jgi:hypothetical protein